MVELSIGGFAWWVLVAVIVLPLAFMFVIAATDQDEDVALARNEVMEDAGSLRCVVIATVTGISGEHIYE